MRVCRKFVTLLCLLPFTAVAAEAAGTAPPQPFTATYQVLHQGSPLGVARLGLTRDSDGTWTFRSAMKATHGLAALLGGTVSETSRFRWHNGRIESLSYDYRLHIAFKRRQRHVTVNWKADTVTVRTSDDASFTYASQPGLVERHLLVLALGRAVVAGQTRIALPVAVKDRVKIETFAVRGTTSVKVPAGTFAALHVVRTHDSKGYSVWYDPGHFGSVPVKLSQRSGGDFTLLLESLRRYGPGPARDVDASRRASTRQSALETRSGRMGTGSLHGPGGSGSA